MALTVSLFILLTSVLGVWTVKEVYVKEGEIMVLRCHGDPTWSGYTTQRMDFTSMSSAERSEMGLLLHEKSLVILRASKKHQGNYSCSLGMDWRLIVYTNLSREEEEKTHYPVTCTLKETCHIPCQDPNALSTISSIVDGGTTLYKDGDLLPYPYVFGTVEMKDGGTYTCTRSYLYQDQNYSKSSTFLLKVESKDYDKLDEIKAPKDKQEVPVDLGERKQIECEAVVYSNYTQLTWLFNGSFVKQNASFPVYYNYTKKNNNNKNIELRASLIFKSVSAGDLSKPYSCKLESLLQTESFVTINLVLKARRSYHLLTTSIAGIVVTMCVGVVIYVKYKIHIALFLRDTLGCHKRISDGKSYDAFLMCYTSDKDAGLNAQDRKWLVDVLEERFDYTLCLYDRDVPLGEAVAQAVLDCIEQSRTVVLVPTALDPGLDCSLLSTIHAALVERQTRLVFIKPETSEVKISESISEGLQLLGDVGRCITWKGSSSMSTSSSFWNQLRYHLPPTACNKRKSCHLESAVLNNNRNKII